ALKTLRRACLNDDAARRFRYESEILARLAHPAIAQVYETGTSDEGPWFAMELADGGTLRERRMRSWDQARGLLASLLRALAHAHARGIVHRDIKPANVLFAGDIPKLTDFGMVFSVDPAGEDGPAGGGTPAYMAPEQFEGERWDLGPWTDLYALGCLAYAVVVGKRPFPGSGWVRLFNAHWHAPIPPVEPLFEVPEGFEDWLHAMMAKNRHHRFQRAADALHALLSLDEPTTIGGLRGARRDAATTTASRRPAYPRPPLPHFRERSGAVRENLAVGLGLYGLRSMPFVGRNQERARLWELLAAVMRDRRPRAVVLRGPAGVGKSRLAQWLLQRTHEVGAASGFRATHAPLPAPLDGLPGL
ncbi:MAG: serine/threonine-protein kinase PknK, partial [Myxococcales bacterium]|nr:serine/threonine-protein kinase PknK [Myxococcales bacterium]